MSIRRNKLRADRLVAAATAERRARQEHAARAQAIFLDRLGSPQGLAACFGAGAVTGWRLGEDGRRARGPAEARPDDEAQKGALERFAESPVGSIAVRLAAATIVRYLLVSTGDGGGAGDEPGADTVGAGGP